MHRIIPILILPVEKKAKRNTSQGEGRSVRCDSDVFLFNDHTTDVTTIDALKLIAKVVFCEAFQSSRRKYKELVI